MSSSSSASTEAAMTIAASGNISGKQNVMKELGKKLMKGRQTPEGRLDDLTEKEKKQVIHENLLAARMHWFTQNKEKADVEAAATPASSSAGGSDESEDDEPPRMQQQGLTHSLEPAVTTRIEKIDDIQTRVNRAYSNASFHKIIPKPPRNPPPSLTNPVEVSSTTHSGVSAEAKTPVAQRAPKNSDAKKPSSEGSAATSKMKKIFKFKVKKIRRKTKKMTSIPPTRAGSVKGEKTRAGESRNAGRLAGQKSMSDSILTKQNVFMSTSSVEEEMRSLPIHTPSLYQNVFDSPEFAKYTQKPPSRSNTSSPLETSQQMKKPKPLPRSSISGGSMGRTPKISTGSERETDLETPPPLHSRMTVISPLICSSPNSAHSDSLTPVFTSQQLQEEDISFTLNEPNGSPQEQQLENKLDCIINTKQRLGKTVSCNTETSGFVLKRKGSSQKQKEFRGGICSEGPLEEEYIRMSTITDCSTLENRPQLAKNFLSVSNLEAYRDSQRDSAAYIKLLPNLLELGREPSTTKEAVRDMPKPAPSKPQLQKMKTIPSLGFHGLKNNNRTFTPHNPYHEQGVHSEYGHPIRLENPPRSSPELVPKKDKVDPPTPFKRKVQYTAVTIEAAGKQRKPSAPKKYKCQTVTLSENGDVFMIPNAESGEKTVLETPADEQIGETGRRKISEQRHPLLSPSPAGRWSPLDNSWMERRYYVNRDSLRIVKISKELPTTMLKTVDPETGKVLWHEYVEIDEEEIDQIASSMGISPTNIPSEPPEKLEVLLSLKSKDSQKDDKTESEEAASIRKELEDNNDSATHEGIIEDSDLSCGSSVSSECKYILNLDDPPTIPPRPANLDHLADEDEYRSSGDYSYAFIPGVGTRWMMLGGRMSPKSIIPSAKALCSVSEKPNSCKSVTPESSPVQSRAFGSTSLKHELKVVRPPSLPPKTDSLLRETELIKPSKKGNKLLPFLPQIIVQTKKSKHAQQPTPANSSEASKVMQQNPPLNSSHPNNRARKRSAPPKVIPYKMHQEQKQYSTPHSVPSESASPSPHEPIPAILLSPDSTNKHETFEGKRHTGNGSIKTHKKLARQRSHGRRSYRKAATKHREDHKKQHLHQTSLEIERSPSLNEASDAKDTESESMPIPGTYLQDDSTLDSEVVGMTATEQTETEQPKRTHGLNKILTELGHLLKISNFSEADLLAAIENHLKQNVKNTSEEVSDVTKADEDEEEKADDSTNEYNEPESWLSGEEPESEVELEETITPENCNPRMSYVNFQIGDDVPEAEPTNTKSFENKETSDKEEDNDELDYENMSNLAICEDRNDDEDSNVLHSYVNLQFGMGIKIYEHDESKRYSYVDLDIESNLDNTTRAFCSPSPSNVTEEQVAPSIGGSSQMSDEVRSKPISDEFTSSSPAVLQRERSKSSAASKARWSLIKPRSSRAQSNPDSELADAVVAAEGRYRRNSAEQPTSQKNKSCSDMSTHKLLHGETCLQLTQGKQSERTSSYRLALQMEDTHLSQSAEVSTSRKRLSAVREEGKS